MTKQKDGDKNFIMETRQVLQSNDYNTINLKIQELKRTGRPSILHYLLDLINSDCPDTIKQEVLVLVGDLKDQGCADILVGYIQMKKAGTYLSQLIASCWQSSLDFSAYLNVFAECFITGDYQTSLESFTVIEEMLWRSKPESITSCIQILESRESEIKKEKKPLYDELLKILEEGRTANSEEYPDLYLN
jgi:hypothetical protein